jgi:hypothetical protein
VLTSLPSIADRIDGPAAGLWTELSPSRHVVCRRGAPRIASGSVLLALREVQTMTTLLDLPPEVRAVRSGVELMVARVVLVVAAVIALGVGSGWPASAISSTSKPARHRPSTTCQSVAAKHHYVQADAASPAGHATHVTAHVAKIHCGGPDDVSYDVTHKRARLILGPRTVVRVIATPGGVETKRIDPSRLPHWLSRDHNSRIFQVTGSRRHVRRLVELFHP